MNCKRILTFVLALTLVLSMAACGDNGGKNTTGGNNTTGSTGDLTGNAVYTVKVADVLGNPYTENIVVLFKQNGEQVAMQPVNAEGVASKELARGQYDVELQITKDAQKYHYAKEGLQLTAENTNLEIVLSNVFGDEFEMLNVVSLSRYLYKLTFGEGSFQLEDLKGDLDGTYHYSVDEEGFYTVTDASGNDVGMSIVVNLDGSFSFLCPGMSFEQPMEQEGEATETLSGTYNVASSEFKAPIINTGCTYMELNTEERNFMVFIPVQSGIYEFTIHNASASLGYYGSPFFVLSENSGTVTGEQSMTVEVKDSMIGSGGAGTTQMVIGIDAEAGSEDCIVSVVRIGDPVVTPEEMPWDIYKSTFTPTKYTLPEGLQIKEFDLTAASGTYNLVFNETDGYYHLGTADGPVVLVRLHAALTYGGSLGDILSNSNVGAYFYDENGEFLKKELYNDCLLQYLGTLNKGMGDYSYTGGMLDDNYGVYPLTKDLEYIIQMYGQCTGWWNPDASNYLFGALSGVNTEMAWLFMCCYAE